METTQKEPVQISLLGIRNAEVDSILVNLQKEAGNALRNYTKNLFSILDKFNISIPPAINLTLNVKGHIELNSTHPDKAEIEDIFNARQKNIDDFKEIEVLHRMMHQIIHGPQSAGDTFHLGLTSLGGITFFTH